MNVCFGSEADPLAGGYTARCFSLRADTLATEDSHPAGRSREAGLAIMQAKPSTPS
jgi:hypothetical protein